MNLDDRDLFLHLDPQDLLGQINNLPDQLQHGWQIGLEQELPNWQDIRQVVMAGMGGSSVGADLIAAYASAVCPIPVIVHRGYGLPSFAHGHETLVIASSYSGDTEETLSSFEAARERNCSILSIATGGQLGYSARQAGLPAWQFAPTGQARAAAGYMFGMLAAAMHRLEVMPEVVVELDEAVSAMRSQLVNLGAEIPVFKNPAKRLAGQLMGRWVIVFGSDYMKPVARRWKAQINETAKAWAQVEVLPEADHNTLAGLFNPESVPSQSIALFLRAPSDHPRNRVRSELTREAFMVSGFGTDFFDAHGSTPLAHMWTALHFGDYVSYYLAAAYGVDPAQTEIIGQFKQALNQS